MFVNRVKENYNLFFITNSPQWGRDSSLSRLHDHTHIHTPQSMRLLWTSDQHPVEAIDNTQPLQETNIHAPGRILTHNPSKRADADSRLISHGYWDRLIKYNQSNYKCELIIWKLEQGNQMHPAGPKVYFSRKVIFISVSSTWNAVWEYKDISSFMQHASCVLLWGKKLESMQELTLINGNVLMTSLWKKNVI